MATAADLIQGIFIQNVSNPFEAMGYFLAHKLGWTDLYTESDPSYSEIFDIKGKDPGQSEDHFVSWTWASWEERFMEAGYYVGARPTFVAKEDNPRKQELGFHPEVFRCAKYAIIPVIDTPPMNCNEHYDVDDMKICAGIAAILQEDHGPLLQKLGTPLSYERRWRQSTAMHLANLCKTVLSHEHAD